MNPTNKIRYIKRKHPIGDSDSVQIVLYLQQYWEDAEGVGEWRDVEIVEE